MSDYHIFLRYNIRNLKEDGPVEMHDDVQIGGFGTQEIDTLYKKAVELAEKHDLRFCGIRPRPDGLLQMRYCRDWIDGFEFHSNSLDDILAFKQEALETKIGSQPLVDTVEVRDYKSQGEGYVQF